MHQLEQLVAAGWHARERVHSSWPVLEAQWMPSVVARSKLGAVGRATRLLAGLFGVGGRLPCRCLLLKQW
jgi:hypothetical protein